MISLQNLILGFFFSFIGSIPPGTINLSVIQLGLRKNIAAALRMGFAAALVEFVYAAIAIKFQIYISSNPTIKNNFILISAAVLILLGLMNLVSVKMKKTGRKNKLAAISASGFRKGVLISMANPLAMPFWIGVTAYLQSNAWIDFSNTPIWSYVCGISFGTLAVLSLLSIIAFKTGRFIEPDNKLIKIIPGIVLLSLGLYSMMNLYVF